MNIQPATISIEVLNGTTIIEERQSGILINKVVRRGGAWYRDGIPVTSVSEVNRYFDMEDRISSTEAEASLSTSLPSPSTVNQ